MDDLAHADKYMTEHCCLVSLIQRLPPVFRFSKSETEMAIRLLRKRKHRFRKKQMVRSIS